MQSVQQHPVREANVSYDLNMLKKMLAIKSTLSFSVIVGNRKLM